MSKRHLGLPKIDTLRRKPPLPGIFTPSRRAVVRFKGSEPGDSGRRHARVRLLRRRRQRRRSRSRVPQQAVGHARLLFLRRLFSPMWHGAAGRSRTSSATVDSEEDGDLLLILLYFSHQERCFANQQPSSIIHGPSGSGQIGMSVDSEIVRELIVLSLFLLVGVDGPYSSVAASVFGRSVQSRRGGRRLRRPRSAKPMMLLREGSRNMFDVSARKVSAQAWTREMRSENSPQNLSVFGKPASLDFGGLYSEIERAFALNARQNREKIDELAHLVRPDIVPENSTGITAKEMMRRMMLDEQDEEEHRLIQVERERGIQSRRFMHVRNRSKFLYAHLRKLTRHADQWKRRRIGSNRDVRDWLCGSTKKMPVSIQTLPKGSHRYFTKKVQEANKEALLRLRKQISRNPRARDGLEKVFPHHVNAKRRRKKRDFPRRLKTEVLRDRRGDSRLESKFVRLICKVCRGVVSKIIVRSVFERTKRHFFKTCLELQMLFPGCLSHLLEGVSHRPRVVVSKCAWFRIISEYMVVSMKAYKRLIVLDISAAEDFLRVSHRMQGRLLSTNVPL